MKTKPSGRGERLDRVLNLLFENKRTAKPRKNVMDIFEELDEKNLSKEELIAMKNEVEIIHNDNNLSLSLNISWCALVVALLSFFVDTIPGSENYTMSLAILIGKFIILIAAIVGILVARTPIWQNAGEIARSKNVLLAIEFLLEEFEAEEGLKNQSEQNEPKEQSNEKNEG